MKPSTISQLQKELITLEHKQVIELAMRMAKYKKENKELLSYLLFDAADEEKFIADIKLDMETMFAEMNTSTMYYCRKSVRKILRYVNKFIKYSGLATTEMELRIYFCRCLKNSEIKLEKSETLMNLYNGQREKIKKTLGKLHEDLQYDYQNYIAEL